MRLRDVREQRRAEEVAALRQVAGRLVELGAFGLTGGDELGDVLQLGARVDRPDIGVLVERIADPDVASRSLSFSTMTPTTDSWTSSRDPAQHTSPWLK